MSDDDDVRKKPPNKGTPGIPGQLKKITALIVALDGKVVEVDHKLDTAWSNAGEWLSRHESMLVSHDAQLTDIRNRMTLSERTTAEIRRRVMEIERKLSGGE